MLSLGLNNDIPLEDNNSVPVKANACYSTVAADIPLEVNESYSTNTPMKANECYGTSTSESLYTEIKELALPDYDYIV